jgi:hypothetical protein
MTQAMSARNCAPSTSSNSAVTTAESCGNNRTLSAPVFLKHKISFSVDSLLSSCSSATRLNGSKFSNCTESSDRDNSANRTSQTRHFLQSGTEILITNDKLPVTSNQSISVVPVTDTCKSPVDTGPVDDCTGSAARGQCDDDDHDDDDCNDDLQDEELEVDDMDTDATTAERLYEDRLHCVDGRLKDDSAGSRVSPCPSVARDTEDMSPHIIPRPLHHPALALGHAAAAGPPCWGFPSGLASQFAWMPLYRSASPSSEYRPV